MSSVDPAPNAATVASYRWLLRKLFGDGTRTTCPLEGDATQEATQDRAGDDGEGEEHDGGSEAS